ncbi:hypothetical protein PUN28_001341 [Cardiocondyla obscurior]|uniref:Uncharacterized protein n=1 Tax=Cardiocondyla obscurior TaxID=286306 RepID=A0AAW2H4Z5_9HYME
MHTHVALHTRVCPHVHTYKTVSHAIHQVCRCQSTPYILRLRRNIVLRIVNEIFSFFLTRQTESSYPYELIQMAIVCTELLDGNEAYRYEARGCVTGSESDHTRLTYLSCRGITGLSPGSLCMLLLLSSIKAKRDITNTV